MHRFKNLIEKRTKNHFVISGIEVIIKDPPSKNVKVHKVLQDLLSRIPKHLLSNLDVIYIGQFEELKKRNFQAMYKNSAVFASNEIKSNDDLLDDLVHEVAHSVEDQYKSFIYSDNLIKKEFIEKRKSLWQILKDEGYSLELEDFLKAEYDVNFDKMLYMEIGYPILGIYTKNLFYSPYGCTSLREYFANGFEAFFMKENINRLKNVSPILYNRIVELLNLKEIG